MHEVIEAAISVGRAEANRDVAIKFDSQNSVHLIEQATNDLRVANKKLVEEIKKYKVGQ
ncbi:hypothetical protein [Secundilactobacillus collinoides]|uniref:Uncharacterized protein n=1 Tax=Secundilactobacillus collinoides DSM 20515 = JCM 1123 TaxID=1423733 RepID=A0A0R2B4B0_SECCO|nr:hypothetical protein [Secundilactobacillus collinoides]KRM74032.1 hypothetical protein FC82_GL000803 [Secundilactobacillus collinoides DSM 20515 = JCM 1123]